MESHNRACQQWLDFVSATQNVKIQHARNGGEKIFYIGRRRFKVDGFDPLNWTIYEFHGCRYHGCPRCYKDRNYRLWNEDRTMEERLEATRNKTNTLRSAGYVVEELWGCQFDNLKKNNPDFFSRNRSIQKHWSSKQKKASLKKLKKPSLKKKKVKCSFAGLHLK